MESLCSTITALYAVLFLYSPNSQLFFQFLFSPVLLATLILLLFLLRFGASQNPQIRDLPDRNCISISPGVETGAGSGTEPDTDPYSESFVEWDVRAPLEVIYEEHCEGEDAGGGAAVAAEETDRYSDGNAIQRYASLALFFPESDGDTSSEEDSPTAGDGYSPESICFRWDDEEEEEKDREGLIEIELNEKRFGVGEVEEENLIEIDLSPAR